MSPAGGICSFIYSFILFYFKYWHLWYFLCKKEGAWSCWEEHTEPSGRAWPGGDCGGARRDPAPFRCRAGGGAGLPPPTLPRARPGP